MAFFLGLFLKRSTVRRPLPALAVLGALVLGLLGAAPAEAVVKTVGETTAGVQPRSSSLFEEMGQEPSEYANPTGAPVLPSSRIYAVYWDPTDHYHGDWQQLVDGFLHHLGAESGSTSTLFSVTAQYTDLANQHALYKVTFGGAYTDTDSYPGAGCTDPSPMQPADAITCLNDEQLREELTRFIGDHTLQRGMGTIFYLLTPPGVTVCLDGGGPTGHCSDGTEPPSTSYSNSFCSYHSDINPTESPAGDPSTTLYAVIPWIAGGLGDHHLTEADQKTSGVACQDGGFNPSSQPNPEESEKSKERNAAEQKAFEEMSATEQEEVESKEGREGPHQEEPNQPSGRSPDGYWVTGLADLIVGQIGVEQVNTVTDPLLNGWRDPNGNENTDECRNFFATPTLSGGVSANEHTYAGTLSNQLLDGANYYINDAFNLAGLQLPYPGVSCLGGLDLAAKFTAPNTVNAGEIAGFDGMESDITLNWGTEFTQEGTPTPTYAVYKWNFGDGTPEVSGLAPGAPSANSPVTLPCEAPWESPCAASTFHAYQYGGTYKVTLTVTDTGGYVSETAQDITVVGPPAPAPEGSSTSSAAAALGAQGSGGSAGAGGPPIPGPVVSATALSKSLRKVLHHGLVVRYSVNEQVAGRFEVILSSRTAQRLGVHGPAATGLPAGSEPALVIAHAIVVTTKGGRSTERITISRATAARLRKLHKLSFMLRMTVRNAARQNPQTATVTSVVKLTR